MDRNAQTQTALGKTSSANRDDRGNSKLAELCTRDPDHFDKAAAEAAQPQFRSSRRRLRADVADVYANEQFWQEVDGPL